MLNSLENDPWLRTRFQYWFFYYDTGNPITYSADVVRTSLRLIIQQLDPDGTDAALRQMVVIGHSQGGLLAKMTAIDSGTQLWDTIANGRSMISSFGTIRGNSSGALFSFSHFPSCAALSSSLLRIAAAMRREVG
jgi:triacylglycerol esterase/lipase EstA (alpha/beta hydrolase family)